MRTNILCLLTACLILFVTLNVSAGTIKITDRNIDIYGSSNQISPGDIITVYDSDDVLCGKFEVTNAGQYGVIHIYGDDITSPDIDEGPVSGDVLSIYLNGIKVTPTNIEELVWTRNGDLIQVDF